MVAKARFYRITQRIWLLALLLVILSIVFRDFLLGQSTICWIKGITGKECPSCGSTRAVLAFFYGDFKHSFRLNFLGFSAVLIWCLFPLFLLYEWVASSSLLFEFYQWIQLQLKKTWVRIFVFCLILVYWIYFYSINVKYIQLHG